MVDDHAEFARERTVVVGLVSDPGLPLKLAQQLSDELSVVLSRRVTNRVVWRLCATRDNLILDSRDRVPIVDKAREMMPHEGWDLMVCVTDHPRRNGSRPILADISSAHGVALISLPALGGIRTQPHVRDTIAHLIGIMAGETLRLSTEHGQRDDHHHIRSRPTELVSPVRQVPSQEPDIDGHLALTGIRGQVRLLFGMVRDNRPWRLLPSLSKAFAAATATAAFGVFYFSIWRIADALSPARLLMISFLSVGAMVVWLIIDNGLWERPRERTDRNKAVLYNTATVLTLFLGVAGIYLLLFAVTLLAATVVITADYLHYRLGHPVGMSDYVGLVWLSSSMGTVAGALGSSLETEEAVRQATYSKREQERRARLREREQQREQQHEQETE